MRWVLGFMRQRDAGRDQQICVTLAAAYLSFYVANSPAEVSGGAPPATPTPPHPANSEGVLLVVVIRSLQHCACSLLVLLCGQQPSRGVRWGSPGTCPYVLAAADGQLKCCKTWCCQWRGHCIHFLSATLFYLFYVYSRAYSFMF